MALHPNGLEIVDLGATAWREVINANFSELLTKIDIETPKTDISFNTSAIGVVLKDRTTGTPYRLFVDNGTLNIETV